MASKISATAPVLYSGVLPNTKKLGAGETLREKTVRRALRAAKALDKGRADPTTRPGTLETLGKKFDGTLARLRAFLDAEIGRGEKDAKKPANPFEVAAFALAGVSAPTPKAKAPKAEAPKRARVPKAPKVAASEASSEPVEAA